MIKLNVSFINNQSGQYQNIPDNTDNKDAYFQDWKIVRFVQPRIIKAMSQLQIHTTCCSFI